MQWIKTVAKEVIGLFVDDGTFAATIIGWIGVVWFLTLHILDGVEWSGAVLFAGLAAILLQSAMRRSQS